MKIATGCPTESKMTLEQGLCCVVESHSQGWMEVVAWDQQPRPQHLKNWGRESWLYQRNTSQQQTHQDQVTRGTRNIHNSQHADPTPYPIATRSIFSDIQKLPHIDQQVAGTAGKPDHHPEVEEGTFKKSCCPAEMGIVWMTKFQPSHCPKLLPSLNQMLPSKVKNKEVTMFWTHHSSKYSIFILLLSIFFSFPYASEMVHPELDCRNQNSM